VRIERKVKRAIKGGGMKYLSRTVDIVVEELVRGISGPGTKSSGPGT